MFSIKKAIIRIKAVRFLVACFGVAAVIFVIYAPQVATSHTSNTKKVTLPFHYAFSVNGKTVGTGQLEESTSPYWWVSSGGYMVIQEGMGMTVQGRLPMLEPVRLKYALTKPEATDFGYLPQNIFRMVLRTKWQDISQETYFKITATNLTDSPQRNASNGIHLMSRYQDQDNLYYIGLRVDGRLAIKKKIAGKYYTLLSRSLVDGSDYDRLTNPNLLPLNEWIGLRAETVNDGTGRVRIRAYADFGRTGKWNLVGETIDDGHSFGGPALTTAGHGGFRTDFIDVIFDDYRLKTAKW